MAGPQVAWLFRVFLIVCLFLSVFMLRVHPASSLCRQHVMLHLQADLSACKQHSLLHSLVGGWWGFVIMFFLLCSLVPFFSFLFFASSLCYAGTLLHHLACNMSCVFCYTCTLLHHLARNTGGRGGGGGGVLCSLVPLSKKTGTQVIDRKWKALKDFLPHNYHRKINGPHIHMAARSTFC